MPMLHANRKENDFASLSFVHIILFIHLHFIVIHISGTSLSVNRPPTLRCTFNLFSTIFTFSDLGKDVCYMRSVSGDHCNSFKILYLLVHLKGAGVCVSLEANILLMCSVPSFFLSLHPWGFSCSLSICSLTLSLVLHVMSSRRALTSHS